MTRSIDGADESCPDEVLLSGTFRFGTHQSNNLYVIAEDGTEYYVGVLFRARYGNPVVTRLRHGRSD
jgi:hypothetical protein